MDTHHKALTVNLDTRRYGTFAEIGAGQEVVRWFFRVGGGAGTIAKSMSAYDMKVSDAIYGRAGRYVCRERLQAMLNHEHQLNLDCVMFAVTAALSLRLRIPSPLGVTRAVRNATDGWALSFRRILGMRTARLLFTYGCWTPRPPFSRKHWESSA